MLVLGLMGVASQDAVAQAPGAPTITSVVSGNNRLIVTFTPPSSIGGSAITSYESSVNGGTSWVTQTTTVYIPGTGASFLTITGLTNGTSYNVQLRAVNSSGPGTASTAVSGTPRTALQLIWDASVNPTTLDSDVDGTNDWVVRDGAAFTGSVTGGIWTGGRIWIPAPFTHSINRLTCI